MEFGILGPVTALQAGRTVRLGGARNQAVLAGLLLRQLQVDPNTVPDGGAERIALWRQRLHGRRAVIVLDNAASSAQLAPLLPPAGSNLVMVTSRNRLGPIDGAATLSLEPLDPGDAVELLRHSADHRVDADPEAAAAIAEMCGRLPLAIRFAGHRLRQRPGWTAAMLREQLGAAGRAPITVGVEGRNTAAAFELSYRTLTRDQQRLFRRLGLHPAGTVEAWAAAALADVPVQSAVELLDGLVETNLVQADVPGRYRLHDLVHAYAEALVDDEERGPATARMLDGYLHALEAAGGHLSSQATIAAGAGTAPNPVADDAAWAVANWSTVVALVNAAERAGTHRQTATLARPAGSAAAVAGRSADALRLAEQVLGAAFALGDDELAAATYRMAASLYRRLGRHADCRTSIQHAIRLYQGIGAESDLCANNITLLRHEGRHVEAIRLAEDLLSQPRAPTTGFPDPPCSTPAAPPCTGSGGTTRRSAC